MQILEYLSQKIKKKIPDGRFLIIFLPNDYDAFATTDNNDASNGIQHLEAFAMHRPKNSGGSGCAATVVATTSSPLARGATGAPAARGVWSSEQHNQCDMVEMST